MRVRLTDRFCSTAVAGAAIQADFFDEVVPGLALRVSQTGRRGWSFHFTTPSSGKRARMMLGSYPAMTLAEARARALEARAHVDRGDDPRRLLNASAATAMTVGDLIASYLDKHATGRRTAYEMRRALEQNVVPMIGTVRLADLHRRDINRVVDPILARGSPIAAARTFEILRAVLRWATDRGDIDHNPIEGMRTPAYSETRERVLSDTEIRTLWASLPTALARSPQVQDILRLCLITGQRVGEIAGMRRDELDLNRRIWSLPGSRTKNGHAHVVPLSSLATGIIERAITRSGDVEHVFGAPVLSDTSVVGHATRLAYRRKSYGLAHWTVHDLRRSVISGMARLGVVPIVLGHVANHRTTTKAGITLGVYNQYSYDGEKRAALELWAEHLTAVIAGESAVVVPLRRA